MTVHSGSPARTARWLESAAQREVLDGLAELIEEHYVFSDVGRRCADDLRSSATKEAGVSASQFARQLTTQLRVHDRHFSVTWGEPDRLRITDREQSEDDAMTFERRERGGVLTIRRFDDIDDPAAADLARRSLMAFGACDYAVIDIRDNDGGWPSMVEYVLAPFLGAVPVHVVTFKSAGRADHIATTRPDPTIMSLVELPVAVLVNGRTASAAESLAYAFQSLSRAMIVGTPTVGAANPVELFAHTSGFHIYISTGAPIDPRTATNWDQTGVQADIIIEDERNMLDIALDIASRTGNRAH